MLPRRGRNPLHFCFSFEHSFWIAALLRRQWQRSHWHHCCTATMHLPRLISKASLVAAHMAVMRNCMMAQELQGRAVVRFCDFVG